MRSSVASSLVNLRTGGADDIEALTLPYIDCFILHSPLRTLSETLIAWRTLEEFVPHRIRHLGIANVNLNNLELLYDLMDIKPAVVQNCFSPSTLFDRGLRRFCVANGIVYQAFGTLTKNPLLLKSEPVRLLAEAMAIEKQMALYCLILGLENVVVLNGTTNEGRMRSDLCEFDRCLHWLATTEHAAFWVKNLVHFKMLVGDE